MRLGLAAGALLLIAAAGWAQRGRFREPEDEGPAIPVREAEFRTTPKR